MCSLHVVQINTFRSNTCRLLNYLYLPIIYGVHNKRSKSHCFLRLCFIIAVLFFKCYRLQLPSDMTQTRSISTTQTNSSNARCFPRLTNIQYLSVIAVTVTFTAAAIGVVVAVLVQLNMALNKGYKVTF